MEKNKPEPDPVTRLPACAIPTILAIMSFYDTKVSFYV